MPATTERRIHMVGTDTYEMPNDAAAMEHMFEKLGPYVASMPSGETGTRSGWVTEDLELLTEHPDIRVLGKHEDPDPKDYLGNKWKMAVKDGHKLDPDQIQHTYHRDAHNNWKTFSGLRKKYGRPDLPYQQGIIGTLQEPIFAFRRKSTVKTLINGFRYRKPFVKSLQREVNNIWNDPEIGDPGRDKRDEVIFQIEVPAEVGGMNKMWKWVQPVTNPVLGMVLGHGIKKQAKGMPEGAGVVIHKCRGDWENRQYADADVPLLVSLAKSIIRGWPRGRHLEGIHMPFDSGDQPPSMDPKAYKALGKLACKLPENTRFIAGFVHPDRSLEELRTIRDMIEESLGRRVDIAAACGLGRVSQEVAERIMDLSVALVKD